MDSTTATATTTAQAPAVIPVEDYIAQRSQWTLCTVVFSLGVLAIMVGSTSLPSDSTLRPIFGLVAFLALIPATFSFLRRLEVSRETDAGFASWLTLARKAVPEVDAFAEEVSRQGRPITKSEATRLRKHYGQAVTERVDAALRGGRD